MTRLAVSPRCQGHFDFVADLCSISSQVTWDAKRRHILLHIVSKLFADCLQIVSILCPYYVHMMSILVPYCLQMVYMVFPHLIYGLPPFFQPRCQSFASVGMDGSMLQLGDALEKSWETLGDLRDFLHKTG